MKHSNTTSFAAKLAAMTSAAVAAAAMLTSCGADEDLSAGLDGAPVVFMNIGTLESPNYSRPEVRTAVEARVKAINESGGIDGRPLKVEFCNDKLNPNDGAACARKAVQDKVVAVVGGATFVGHTILPILEKANIPWLAGKTISDVENQSPISFPIQATHAINAGLGHIAAQEGGSIGIVSVSNPVMEEAARWETEGAAAVDAALVPKVYKVPEGTVDFNGTISDVVKDKPDNIILNAFPNDVPKLVRGLHQAGYDGQILASRSLMSDTTIRALGGDADGILVAHAMRFETDTDVSGIREFRAQMQAADPQAVLNDTALNAWAGVGLLAAVAKELENVDGPSIIDYLNSLSQPIPLDDVVPDFGSGEAPSDLPRDQNFFALRGEVVDGQITSEGEWFNPLAGS